MSARPLLLGRGGPWPFGGYFRGGFSHGDTQVTWAGCVTDGEDLVLAWRAARAVQAALLRAGPVAADRRRALSVLWARLDGVPRDTLGGAVGGDLSLLVVATDPDGASISGTGLGSLVAPGPTGQVTAWVDGEHPILTPPGIPATRPGALSVTEIPPWLCGVPHGRALQLPARAPLVLRACGVQA